ncbi:MAG: hypothetical protein P1P89_00925 [Desulfobacterales bacterium]|nr:hypothetical protein [Desulfobacterales bacterium]
MFLEGSVGADILKKLFFRVSRIYGFIEFKTISTAQLPECKADGIKDGYLPYLIPEYCMKIDDKRFCCFIQKIQKKFNKTKILPKRQKEEGHFSLTCCQERIIVWQIFFQFLTKTFSDSGTI